MTSLAGSHILVTGGSQGIGEAFTRAAIARGATVSILARNSTRLRAVAESTGASWRSADVTDAAALDTAIASLVAERGPVDILVTCAGRALPGRFLDTPLAEFREQVDLNYLGTIAAVKAVLPGMVARGHGHIALTSSTAGVLGVVGYTGYGPTKWAIRGLAETLRYETEPSGVRISVLYPPDTDTPGFASENMRKPVETRAVSGAVKPVSAERVAIALANGIERNRRNIAIDTLTRLLLPLGGVLEPVLRASMRGTIAKALRDDSTPVN